MQPKKYLLFLFLIGLLLAIVTPAAMHLSVVPSAVCSGYALLLLLIARLLAFSSKAETAVARSTPAKLQLIRRQPIPFRPAGARVPLPPASGRRSSEYRIRMRDGRLERVYAFNAYFADDKLWLCDENGLDVACFERRDVLSFITGRSGTHG